jgi:hypothetical protein
VQGSAGIAVGFSWKDGPGIGFYASGGAVATSAMKPSSNVGVIATVAPKAQTVKDIVGTSTGGGIGGNILAAGGSLDRIVDGSGNNTYF